MSVGRQVTWGEVQKSKQEYERTRNKLIVSGIAVFVIGAAILYLRREARRRKSRMAMGRAGAALLRIGAVACGLTGLGLGAYTALQWYRGESPSLQLLMLGLISFSFAGYLDSAAPRRGRTAVSAAVARNRDPRPPILYLRGFEAEDQLASDLGAFGELTDATSVEDAMLPKLERLGPIVALENVAQPTIPAAYAREAPDPRKWRKSVRRLATEARTIIVLLSGTAGLAWELAMLVRRGMIPKTVLVFPPGGQEKRAALWQTFIEAASTVDPNWAESAQPWTEEELVERAAVAVVFDASSSPTVLTDVANADGYAALAEAIAAWVERT